MPHASGVSITLERHGQPTTVAASSDAVVTVDHHQYDTGQGPCLDANTYEQWLSVDSLAEETRWPAFVPRAMDEGIRSILSLPLKGTRSHGSLNLYATIERAFGEPEQQLATLLAAGASRVLTTADQHTNDEFA
ncbi:MAG: hypothetical protein JWN62_4149 [Acidimicrobiales bacterium]|nr:hypothetical protein [Acidimicrobiales bacterium]